MSTELNVRRRASWALTLALSATVLTGCFNHPDDKVSQMVCTTDNNCPTGYTCSKLPGAATGSCQKAGSTSGAGGSDGSIGVDGASKGGAGGAKDGSAGGAGGAKDGSTVGGGGATDGSAGGAIGGGAGGATGGAAGGAGGGTGGSAGVSAMGGGPTDAPLTPIGGASGGSGGSSAPPIDAGAMIGTACKSSADCPLGYCVDGVCCDGACKDACYSCAQLYTSKTDGTCAPVAAGKQDPRATCVDQTATNQCGSDGTCDGAGACRKVGAELHTTDASGSAICPTAWVGPQPVLPGTSTLLACIAADGTCPPGTTANPNTQVCEPPCPPGTYFDAFKLTCLPVQIIR